MSLYGSATAESARVIGDGSGIHGGGGRLSVPLRLDATAPRCARVVVDGALAEWGLKGVAETAALIVSELVTNAVVHGCEPAALMLYTDPGADGGLLFVEVDDAGPAKPERRAAGFDAESGRGLVLVDALAADWGCEATGGGKRVWASIGIGAAS